MICHPAIKNDSSAILRFFEIALVLVRLVVRADEKLTAFMELESATRACGGLVLTG